MIMIRSRQKQLVAAAAAVATTITSTSKDTTTTTAAATSVVTAIPAENIGNKLLKKMGWKEGEGLGRDGTGITKPVEAEGYAKGAGIGTQGAKMEVADFDGSFAEKVRNAARRRFENS